MNLKIIHRGPDDSGVYIDDDISLGNVRLSIVDLTKKGHMPMITKDGRYVITYNGEIYNFQKLRRELINKGYKFTSHTDTEVILNLYAEYGESAIKKLNGMFAFAIYDKKQKKIIIARDRCGIKPLYYTIIKNQLIFSSEIKAILLHQLSWSIDKTSMDLYMRLAYVPAPYTIYKNIYKLQPGEFLTYQHGFVKKKFFWNLISKPIMFKHKSLAVNKLKALLANSVKQQLFADRPVGIFLSGGIDSTSITAFAVKNHKQIKTFSIGFSDIPEEEKFNKDFLLARYSAKYFGTTHHEFIISPKKALEDFIALSSQLDEPIANPTHIPTYALAEGTRTAGVVVALGGDGGDELFGGYDRYKDAWLLRMYQELPEQIRTPMLDYILQRLHEQHSPDFIDNLKAKSLAEKYLVFMGQSKANIESIYKSSDKQLSTIINDLRGFKKANEKLFYKLFPWLDYMHWLPEESLMRSDKMTMLWHIEQRVPFLENHLINFAQKIPFEWKVGPRLRKKILREAVKDIIPQKILVAPKRGFFSPAAKWLRDRNWKELLAEYFSTSSLKKSGYFHPKAVQKMLKDHQTQKQYNLQLLWSVLQFQIWYENNKNHLC